MRFALLLIAAALACPAIGGAMAQTPAPEPSVPMQPSAPKLDPKACTDKDRLANGDVVENDGRGLLPENPSEKLARTESVICPPPGLDPHIRAPAPATGSNMPVIPPPEKPAEPGARPN